MPSFTVCIPVFNGSTFLGEALQSIAVQDLDGIEVLVSDNASTDSTPKILESWANRLPLRVVRRTRTLSMQDHFNALLGDVTGDAYMLLCHDDYLATSDTLAKARAVLQNNPEVAVVYCDLVYVDERRRTLARRRFGRSGSFDGNGAGIRTLASGRNQFGIPLAIRRSALGELRYDPRFHYTMDVDLSWALAKCGKAYHIPECLIANRYSAGNTTWRLLQAATREYIDLTAKYVGTPGRRERLRLRMMCSLVSAQKLAFRLFERTRSWFA